LADPDAGGGVEYRMLLDIMEKLSVGRGTGDVLK